MHLQKDTHTCATHIDTPIAQHFLCMCIVFGNVSRRTSQCRFQAPVTFHNPCAKKYSEINGRKMKISNALRNSGVEKGAKDHFHACDLPWKQLCLRTLSPYVNTPFFCNFKHRLLSKRDALCEYFVLVTQIRNCAWYQLLAKGECVHVLCYTPLFQAHLSKITCSHVVLRI